MTAVIKTHDEHDDEKPPERVTRREGQLPTIKGIYRPHDKQGDVEPFDVEADWKEKF